MDIESEKAAIQKVIDEHMDTMDSLDMNKLLDGLTEDHLGKQQAEHKLDYNLHPEKYDKTLSLIYKNHQKFKPNDSTKN